MRIAMVAPIWESVPPPCYGGIERVVATLTTGLIRRGHDVTLFASGDSTLEAPLAYTEPRALRQLGHDTFSQPGCEALHLASAFARTDFDLFHNHSGSLGVAFAHASRQRCLTTLHGPLETENVRYFAHFHDHPYVSLSDAQRLGAPGLRYLATVYNGIETARYEVGLKQGYLLYLGRLSPEKGVHLAIEVAQRAGWPLVLAGKVDPFDEAYFDSQIRPRLDPDRVRFVGEVGGRAKSELLAGAVALLHLVQWPEPFGLTMVEAMAAGTPVVAMPYGSIPEVVAHGLSGFVVEGLEAAVAALGELGRLDPRLIRQYAVQRFDAERMIDAYEALYQELAAGAARPKPRDPIGS